MGEVQREHCQSIPDWDQTLSFQYPLSGAFWTFCSPKSKFRAVATVSGRLRSCSAKSRSLTTTSPVGTVGGLCDGRWKSYRRVLEAPLSCFAAHVGTGPHRFPDTVWS